jgi:hypothetical protein
MAGDAVVDGSRVTDKADVPVIRPAVIDGRPQVYFDDSGKKGAWNAALNKVLKPDADNHVNGYIFKADGSWVASLPEENMGPALAKMRELQSAMESQTGKKWHRALIHIARETTAMNAQFEYDDPPRWQIVPSKLEESVNALRP